METMTFFLLALAQLSVVYSLPAGESHHKPAFSHKRQSRTRTHPPTTISYSSARTHPQIRPVRTSDDLEPTTSYSTAITSLQSVSITVLPSITGVCILSCRFTHRLGTDRHILIHLLELPHWTSFKRNIDYRSRTWPWSYPI
jgi:hypothetical protein